MKMRNPKARKWITWEIPQKYLDETPSAKLDKFAETIMEEATKALEDMTLGLPVSFKITNLPKEY